jgi:hypothetical protein
MPPAELPAGRPIRRRWLNIIKQALDIAPTDVGLSPDLITADRRPRAPLAKLGKHSSRSLSCQTQPSTRRATAGTSRPPAREPGTRRCAVRRALGSHPAVHGLAAQTQSQRQVAVVVPVRPAGDPGDHDADQVSGEVGDHISERFRLGRCGEASPEPSPRQACGSGH